MLTDLSYRAVEMAMTELDSLMSAAEVHGTATGMLCVGALNDANSWLVAVFGDDDIGGLAAQRRCLVGSLFQATSRVLEEESCSFALFLPTDDVTLNERAQALSEWCRGFLYGLGCGGGDRVWPRACHEIMRDLAEIARLNQHARGEADEVAYMELTEYVRVGTQLIHSELRWSGEKEALGS